MIGKAKALTLALVAVCAFGAVAASGASAAEFRIAGMGAATGDGTQIAGSPVEFVIPEGELKCPTAIFNVHTGSNAVDVDQETSAQTATVKVGEQLGPGHPADSETLTCTFLFFQTVVHMNGCDWVIQAAKPRVKVKCPVGQRIVATVFLTGVTKCTIHIPEQVDLEGITIDNTANDINVTSAVQGIKYQTTAGTGVGACAATTNAVDGKFNGQVTVQGTAGGVASKLQYS